MDPRDWLECDTATGRLWWKVKPAPRVKVGAEAGGVRGGRYLSVQINGRGYFVHRVVWFFAHGSWPTKPIDHINGDIRDNRIENLREVTHSENQWNRKNDKRNVSGFKGVTKQGNKWVAQIRVNRQLHRLGLFDDVNEAAAAYARAAKTMHAGFSRPGTLALGG